MRHPVIVIARYTLLEAIKNRLFIMTLTGLVCIFGFTQFAGELAVTETREVQGSLACFILRLVIVMMTVLFVVTSTLREFNDKTVDLLISLPYPRHTYYFGKLTGFCLFGLIVCFLAGLTLLVYADPYPVVIWVISLIFEVWLMIAVSLLFLFTFGNMTAACMGVAAFYILARSISTIQLLGQSPVLETAAFSHKFITGVIDIINVLLPALHEFTRTEWLVYGEGNVSVLMPVILQTLIYMALLSAAALFDLYRKNF